MVPARFKSQLIAVVYILAIIFLYVAMEALDGSSKLSFNTSASPGPEAAAAAAEPGGEGTYDIFIDLTQSMLYLFKDNKLLKKYPVAQGKPETPSPIGIWQISTKARNWGTGFGTRWLGLNVPWGRYGIHGTNRPGSIGHRASHGCFRMRNRDVEALYSLVPYKTRVIVWGGPYGNMGSSFDKLEPGDRKSQVAEVQKRLKNLGYYNGSIDGIYGEGMKAGLIRFKKDHGLNVDHYVDWATYKALGIIPFE